MPSFTDQLRAWSDLTQTIFQVTIDPSEISGSIADSGGALHLPIKVDPDMWGSGPCLIAIDGWLKLGTLDSNAHGYHAPLQTRFPNTARTIDFALSTADLSATELRRGSGDMVCALTLRGLGNIPYRPAMQHQGGQDFLTLPLSDNSGITFTIPREHWLKVLNECGHGQSRLVELPALAEPSGPKWSICTNTLQIAVSNFQLGRYEDAIANCRKVMEGILEVVAGNWGLERRPRQDVRPWLQELAGRLRHVWPEDEQAANVLAALYQLPGHGAPPLTITIQDWPLRRKRSLPSN